MIIILFGAMTDDEKSFIHLRFVNEMRFKGISELLGITEEAAKNVVNVFKRKYVYIMKKVMGVSKVANNIMKEV